MGTTSNFALRYPALTDTPDGATQIQNLADDTDAAILAQTTSEWVRPLTGYKAADTARASTIALANDADLVVPGPAVNAVYEFEAFLFYTGNTQGTSDLKFQWSVPAGASLHYTAQWISTGGTVQVGAGHFDGDHIAAGTNGAGGYRAVTMKGTLIMGATAGALQLLWAQNTSNATSTTLREGCWVRVRRLA